MKLVNISKREYNEVLKAAKTADDNQFTNSSMYGSSAAADFTCNGNVYQIEEIFETISSIKKYE